MEEISDELLTIFIHMIEGLKEDYKKDKKKINDLIINYNPTDDDFLSRGWYYLYELPPIVTFALYFQHLGILDILTSLKTSKTPNLDLLKLPTDDIVDTIDYENTPLNKALLAMFIHVFMCHVACVERNNLHMSELLEKGNNGDDASFFNAIRIDRTVMLTPSFALRLEKAAIKNDKDFFSGLRKSLKKQNATKWTSYDKTRLVIKLFQEADQLDTKSIEELYQTFCVDHSLYPDTGTDPAKSLHQFVYRIKKSFST